jgi:hypothetical protein
VLRYHHGLPPVWNPKATRRDFGQLQVIPAGTVYFHPAPPRRQQPIKPVSESANVSGRNRAGASAWTDAVVALNQAIRHEICGISHLFFDVSQL